MPKEDYSDAKYPHKDLTEKIIAAAIEVHRILGPGYVESVYERALAYELDQRKIRYRRQVVVDVQYKEIEAGRHRLDFIVEDVVALELKAAARLIEVHEAQMISSMKSARVRLGLLINFNMPRLVDGLKRFIL